MYNTERLIYSGAALYNPCTIPIFVLFQVCSSAMNDMTTRFVYPVEHELRSQALSLEKLRM